MPLMHTNKLQSLLLHSFLLLGTVLEHGPGSKKLWSTFLWSFFMCRTWSLVEAAQTGREPRGSVCQPRAPCAAGALAEA